MNELVFNTQQQPLYVIDSSYYAAVTQGNAYITTANSNGLLAINSYLVLRIKNATTTNKKIYIKSVSVTSTGTNLFQTVTLLKGDSTLVTPTVPATFCNANIGLTTTNSSATIQQSIQTSAPTNGNTQTIEIGTQVNSIFANNYNGGLLLTTNTFLTVYIQNLVGVATGMYIKIVFWEQ